MEKEWIFFFFFFFVEDCETDGIQNTNVKLGVCGCLGDKLLVASSVRFLPVLKWQPRSYLVFLQLSSLIEKGLQEAVLGEDQAP